MFTYLKKKFRKIQLNKFIHNTSIEKIDSISGYDFENYVSALFESAGFDCKATPKSKDNGVDLIVTKDGISIAVQTKLYYNHKVSNSAVQEVYTGADYFGTTISIVITNWYFSSPAITVADKLNVGLIDRTTLTSLIQSNSRERKYIIENIIYNLYTKKQPLK